jgi:hypothetical protein
VLKWKRVKRRGCEVHQGFCTRSEFHQLLFPPYSGKHSPSDFNGSLDCGLDAESNSGYVGGSSEKASQLPVLGTSGQLSDKVRLLHGPGGTRYDSYQVVDLPGIKPEGVIFFSNLRDEQWVMHHGTQSIPGRMPALFRFATTINFDPRFTRRVRVGHEGKGQKVGQYSDRPISP